MKSEVFNMDCVEAMKSYPDNYFELAIVDPPYNVDASDGSFGNRGYDSKTSNLKRYANHNKTPDKDYFDELFRISKNQIIWGSNYYPQFLHHSGAIVWHKKTVGPLSDCEIAFQSFNKLVKYCFFEWYGFRKGFECGESRLHPNQKPVQLYRWLLQKYAKPNDKILDTHLGSGSSRIAADMEGYNFTGYELDKDYFDEILKRFEEYKLQTKLL
jgi:site-specific DNA-methyltransferase (adenine-specific)